MTVAVAHDLSGPAEAPVVVLLNSLGATRRMWDPQVAPLSEHLRVIRCDLRGHGHSPTPDGPYSVAELGGDILALLDTLRIERAHVVGLSLGGMVGQWLAAHAPWRVQTLSLLCTTAHFPDPQPWHQRAEAVRERGCAALASGIVARWFTPELARRDPELIARHEVMMGNTPAEGYAACCDAIAAWDGRADLGRIAARTLVIAGADDPATPPEHARVIVDGIAGAQLCVVAHAAHLANVEQAGALTRLILDHILGGDARTTGMRIRREVLGDAHVDRSVSAVTEFTAPFQDFITRTAWGDVWNRPGLDRATRSIITLTALTAMGNEHELALHVRAALTNGVTPEQIAEVLLHTAVYAGVPRSNRAFAVAQQVLDSDWSPSPSPSAVVPPTPKSALGCT